MRMEDYEQYYKKQKADSNCGFAEEFEVKHKFSNPGLLIYAAIQSRHTNILSGSNSLFLKHLLIDFEQFYSLPPKKSTHNKYTIRQPTAKNIEI